MTRARVTVATATTTPVTQKQGSNILMPEGYAIAMGPCVVCREICSFNPERVPSFQGQPICKDCVTKANCMRRDKGLEEIVIYDDSYSVS
jgi:hypothetical protein